MTPSEIRKVLERIWLSSPLKCFHHVALWKVTRHGVSWAGYGEFFEAPQNHKEYEYARR
jgi:hypothetical protein